ncbi:MAG: hypothetical protein GXC94_03570 [Comamonadaceae bacterium]|jgi:anti-sigma factor RsiW|nr:hypothetical protein [Comamonadaceae bacterium]
MNELDDDPMLHAALRQHLRQEPDDAGFSLRVMAALPPQLTPGQRRRARWLRWSQWLAASLAAWGAAALLSGAAGPLDGPHLLAAATLLGLLIFWSIPSRWSAG